MTAALLDGKQNELFSLFVLNLRKAPARVTRGAAVPGALPVEQQERVVEAAAVVDAGFRLPSAPLDGAIPVGDCVAPRTLLCISVRFHTVRCVVVMCRNSDVTALIASSSNVTDTSSSGSELEPSRLAPLMATSASVKLTSSSSLNCLRASS